MSMNDSRIMSVLYAPHISEKSARAGELGQYVFMVAPDATKPEIKQAVEKMFKVEVIGVQVANAKGKERRFGRRIGRTNKTRKAYVRLKDGQSIDFGLQGAA